jgi:hypothetical protein
LSSHYKKVKPETEKEEKENDVTSIRQEPERKKPEEKGKTNRAPKIARYILKDSKLAFTKLSCLFYAFITEAAAD